jgi:transcriptional regulator with XRE-family HTH domain
VDGVVVLGRNVRRIRQERQLSLGNLAERTGLAKQTVANLESGRGNPTVATLLAISRALGVGVNWLVTEWGSPILVRRSGDAEWSVEGPARRRLLDSIYGTGQVDTALLELSDERHVADALPPGTLHHAYVMAGEVLAGPVEDVHQLAAGDFIRFAGDVPHVLRSASGTALAHVVTTVPRVQHFSDG